MIAATLASQVMATMDATICELRVFSLLLPLVIVILRLTDMMLPGRRDECERTDPPVCPDQTTCTNTDGTYYCSACSAGYESDGAETTVPGGFHFTPGAQCLNPDDCLVTP
eukprot:COSAG06_NODE_11886_length_1452_cov_1.190687_2_plen_111_part_00